MDCLDLELPNGVVGAGAELRLSGVDEEGLLRSGRVYPEPVGGRELAVPVVLCEPGAPRVTNSAVLAAIGAESLTSQVG